MTGKLLQLRPGAEPIDILGPRVIGAIMSNGAMPGLRALLDASGLDDASFKTPWEGTAFRVCRALARAGKQVNAVMVISTGRTRHAFSSTHEQTLVQLELNNVVTPDGLAQLIDDLRLTRRVGGLAEMFSETAKKLRGEGLNSEEVWATLSHARQLLQEEITTTSTDVDLHQLLDRWDRLEREGKSLLVPTGVKLLDDMVGGLPHNLTLLAGDPSSGKTGLVASSMRAQLEMDDTRRLGLFGLEDGTSWLTRRWIAADTGMALREVGWKYRDPAQREAVQASAERCDALLRRVSSYKLHKITPGDLVRHASAWVRQGVTCFWVDNASQLEITAPRFTDPVKAFADALEELRNFAIEHAVAFVLLTHTKVEGGRPRVGPPEMHLTKGGRANDQKARLMLGTWKKDTSWRVTMMKGNELGEAGGTIELERIPHAAMINPDGGRLLNLKQEAAIDRKEREADREAERRLKSKKRREEEAREKAAEKAAAAKAEEEAKARAEPQAALPLEVK